MAVARNADVEVLRNFVGGAAVESRSEVFEDVFNPATGEVIAQVPLSNVQDVDAAAAVATKAFTSWREVPIYRRSGIMFRFKALLDQNVERLARSITQEHGKSLAEARAEVARGTESVEFAAGITSHIRGTTLENAGTGVDVELFRQPLGVVAGICPYNFPAMIPLWMFPIAIACGNAFILKPSERTPKTANLLAELLAEAGVPEGVFNIVHGGRDVVDALMAHPEVAAISFVGSRAVAEIVYRTAAAHGKRVQAMSGAKNHMIVLPDADLSLAVEAVTGAAYGSAGQRCMAGSVLVPHQDVAEPLLAALDERLAQLKIGSGLEPGVEMGPLIRQQHRERVLAYIERGAGEGARLVRDGRSTQVPDEGFFLGPTLFDQVAPEMSIAREEIFGPVLGAVRARDLDEAIALVNRSEYGNGAVLFTSSGRAAREFRRRANAGMIGINIGVPAPVSAFPFSGWKKSFYGTVHVNGMDGVEFFTDKKVVTSRW